MGYVISTRLMQSEKMTRGEYNIFRGWNIPQGENRNDVGYKVTDTMGHVSWVPEEQYNRNFLKVDENSKLPSGVSIGPKMVEDFIVDYEVFTKKDKITIVIATLRNGFTIVESSACVDPKNYNEEIGAEICKERIKNQVWNHLGFLIQTAFKGVK